MRIAMFSWETLHSQAAGGIAAHVTELAAALERLGICNLAIRLRRLVNSVFSQNLFFERAARKSLNIKPLQHFHSLAHHL